MCGARASCANGRLGNWKAMVESLLHAGECDPRGLSPRPYETRHACKRENFNPETVTKRSFALKCAADRGIGDREGEAGMAKFFANLNLVLIAGLVLAVLIA